MNDDQERWLRAAGRIKDLEANVGCAIHLCTAERLSGVEAVEYQTARLFHRCEQAAMSIARRTCIDGFCGGNELSRTDDFCPTVGCASAIVEAEFDHVVLFAPRS